MKQDDDSDDEEAVASTVYYTEDEGQRSAASQVFDTPVNPSGIKRKAAALKNREAIQEPRPTGRVGLFQ